MNQEKTTTTKTIVDITHSLTHTAGFLQFCFDAHAHTQNNNNKVIKKKKKEDKTSRWAKNIDLTLHRNSGSSFKIANEPKVARKKKKKKKEEKQKNEKRKSVKTSTGDYIESTWVKKLASSQKKLEEIPKNKQTKVQTIQIDR